MAGYLLCLVAVLVMTSAMPSREFPDHVKRIIQSEDTNGYDIATVHAVDSVTREETRQTRSDIAEHADSPINEQTYSLQFQSGQRLGMSLKRRTIDVTGATFRERTEDGRTEIIDFKPRDCFFSGELEGEEGFASISMCDGELVGYITTPGRDYEIHSLPDTDDQDSHAQVMVTWQNTDPESDPDLEDSLDIPEEEQEEQEEEEEEEEEEAEKRSARDHRGTIEVCDVVDKFFLDLAHRKLGISNNSQIIELLISKWSAAAHMLSNETQVGWDLSLRLVSIDIWRSHPDYYLAQENQRMGARLGEICNPTQHWKCDQLSLHTGRTSDPKIVGLAWVGGMCNARRRCSALRSANRSYMAELHEMGHTMGLKHDAKERRCINGTDPVHGFMGGNRYHFRECYKEVLAITLPKKTCIFNNAVNTSDIVMDFSD